jgi:hypothetical protein
MQSRGIEADSPVLRTQNAPKILQKFIFFLKVDFRGSFSKALDTFMIIWQCFGSR